MADTQPLAPCPHCGATASGYAIEAHSHSTAIKAPLPELPNHPGSYVIEGGRRCGSGMIGEMQAEVTRRWNRRALQGDALDTARLDWLLGDGRRMAIDAFGGNYRVVDVSCNLVITDWMPTPRAAIDAARAAQEGK